MAEKAKVRQWLETEATAMKKRHRDDILYWKKLSACDTGRLSSGFKVALEHVSSTITGTMSDTRWCSKQGLWGGTCTTLKLHQGLKAPCVTDKIVFLPEWV